MYEVSQVSYIIRTPNLVEFLLIIMPLWDFVNPPLKILKSWYTWQTAFLMLRSLNPQEIRPFMRPLIHTHSTLNTYRFYTDYQRQIKHDFIFINIFKTFFEGILVSYYTILPYIMIHLVSWETYSFLPTNQLSKYIIITCITTYQVSRPSEQLHVFKEDV